uniref:Homogentisate phytyltransferase 1 n=1 Tax=Anthriscus sylvestris TaxID=48027 RepID=A0AAT9USZ0_9APIA
MSQTFISACFSSCLQHPLRQKGFLTSFQLQRRNRRILNSVNEKQYRGSIQHKLSHSAESFRRSSDKPRPYRNLFVQSFGTTSDEELDLQPKNDQKVSLESNLWKYWDAFYRFSRPYTVVGMIAAVSSLSLLPVTSVGDLSPALFVGFLQALILFVLANIYVAGINQLIDVDIDKINKPYLPLASGDFSMGQGKAIVSALAFMCLAMVIVFQSPPLFLGILSYFLLGTAYSVEPFRWKTNPYLAAFCILGFFGLSIPLAVFYHIQNVLGKPLLFTKALGFGVIFISLFAVVLAMMKDIPDVEGDRAFGNLTFSVRHGKEKVFSLCVNLLMIAYGFAVVVGASSSFLICKLVSVIGHCTLASILLLRAKSLNLNDDEATQDFYMFLYKLYYAEYVLIHFIR